MGIEPNRARLESLNHFCDMRLQNKTALITGGNSGIGLAAARLFVAEGARVAITGRNKTTIDAVAKELGPKALTFQADVLDAKAREAVFTKIKGEFGHLDVVFANAGIPGLGSIADTSEERFDEVLRTNLTGAFLTIKSALPLLGPGASIILNGSIAESVAFPPGAGSYAASKGGLHSMSRAMAAELSPLGIRINVVAPGPIKTPISERLQLPPEQREAVKQKLNSSVPLGRHGDAEEVAKVVLFLASDDSSYVNASEIVVDGGVTGALFGAPVYR
jgi:NAD(P)-dependent dehydrogenase (short-subunit alcohol dehydrogenase family)